MFQFLKKTQIKARKPLLTSTAVKKLKKLIDMSKIRVLVNEMSRMSDRVS